MVNILNISKKFFISATEDNRSVLHIIGLPTSPCEGISSFFSSSKFSAPQTNQQVLGVMKVWVADELGQIKSCTVDKRAADGERLDSTVASVSTDEEHDRSDYVQLMSLVKWGDDQGKEMVSPLLPSTSSTYPSLTW